MTRTQMMVAVFGKKEREREPKGSKGGKRVGV
jgi:hypothetical protein